MVSPKWQTKWIESQHCSKSISNVPLCLQRLLKVKPLRVRGRIDGQKQVISRASQQAKNILEDLKTSCSSPNKAVQVEALKCWGLWIQNQTPEDWKLNTVCFTAVRPLVAKKLQPLHKDVDICKLKLSLMWTLLVKVQDIMQLEGPQYILEVFLQSCLTWLSSSSEDSNEKEVFQLIFKLLLAVFNKNESPSDCDIQMFPQLSADLLHHRKVFHRLADKFVNVFLHWKKVDDKTLALKIWKHFLGHCEISHEHVPVPVWHKVFKLAGQISSERELPLEERLAFLHCCATTLKSALSSSKFIDFGNLLTTPCEVLLKKLVELCTGECDGPSAGSDLFLLSKGTCQVLADRSVAIGGYDLCIGVVDVLEEFSLRSLFWGVWCGLVHCYHALLNNLPHNLSTNSHNKFYRKLRGVAVNFELDRHQLSNSSRAEVEKHIKLLNIGCLCSSHKDNLPPDECLSDICRELVPRTGEFSLVPFRDGNPLRKTRTILFNFDLVKNILNTLTSDTTKPFLNLTFTIRLMRTPVCAPRGKSPREVKVVATKSPPKKTLAILQKLEKRRWQSAEEEQEEEEVIPTRKTRSRRRAEEEEEKKKKMKMKMEEQKRRKRKSFEDLVQEIVRKNKERKTEKNSIRERKRRSADAGKRGKKDGEEKERKKGRGKTVEASDRKLRKKEETEKETKKKEKKKNPSKKDGKLENYFKVITKKIGSETKKESKKKKKKRKTEKTCCEGETEEGRRDGNGGWKQTSLKTMMKSRGKQRGREKDVAEDKQLASPFKEVFHDHEYAKTERRIDLEKMVTSRKDKRSGGAPKQTDCSDTTPKQTDSSDTAPKQTDFSDTAPKQTDSSDTAPEKTAEEPPPVEEAASESTETEKIEIEEVFPVEIPAEDTPEMAAPEEDPPKQTEDMEMAHPPEEESGEDRRGKKRPRILDSLKPSKRMKVEEEEVGMAEEERLPLEVTEKENLEEKELSGKVCWKGSGRAVVGGGSGRAVGGGGMSRALRIIGLVPESTKGRAWEASPRVEGLKCKKPPNVDKNSRASKMLALLSENVVEADEAVKGAEEEFESGVMVVTTTTTPNGKTPLSSLKSPKSVKKRRSIRFDDARNETVLYEIDTPPSQILEEREKRRGTKPFLIPLQLP